MSDKRLTLLVNETNEPNDGRFNIKPSALESWLESLPLANLGETTRQVYRALKQLNYLDIKESERFEAAETFRPTVRYILNGLREHFVGRNFPLTAKQKNIFDLVLALLGEYALTYKLIIYKTVNEKGKASKKQVHTSCYRAIKYLAESLLESYSIYAPAPENVWFELNQIFEYAANAGFAETAIADTELATGKKSSVASAYNQIALLEAATPYKMPHGECLRLYRQIEQWAKYANVISTSTPPENCLYRINFDSDHGPLYLHSHKEVSGSRIRFLDTSSLIYVIEEQLNLLHEKRWLKSATIEMADEDLFKRFLLTLGEIPKRKYARHEAHHHVKVAVGLTLVHHFLADDNIDEPAHAVSHFETDEERDAYSPKHKQKNHDVWELIYPEELPGNRQSQTTTLSKQVDYQAVDWEVINSSAGGYCLLADKNKNTSVQVGDLVVVSEEDKPNSEHIKTWQTGVVRWLRHSETEGSHVGVQLLAAGASAARAQAEKTPGVFATETRTLVLPPIKALNQGPSIITPTLHFEEGKKAKVFHHGHLVTVLLKKLIDKTSTYCHFEYEPLDKKDFTRPGSKEHKTSKDHFEHLWGSI